MASMAFDYLGIALIAIHINYFHFSLIIFGIITNFVGIFYMLKPRSKSCTLKILIAITLVDFSYLLVALVETLTALELVPRFSSFALLWWVGNFLTDASVGLNLSLAAERYVGTCRPDLLIKHPNLRQAWIFALTGRVNFRALFWVFLAATPHLDNVTDDHRGAPHFSECPDLVSS